jgi:DNA-binding CsgD family transcriptional regulator
MPGIKTFSEVIAAIQGAAFRTERWPAALDAVAAICGARHAVMFTPSIPRTPESIWISSSVDEHNMEHFVTRYLSNDLWQGVDGVNGVPLKGIRGAGCVRRHDQFPAHFIRPRGMGRILSGIVLKEANTIVPGPVHISLLRRQQQRPFQPTDESMLRHLIPHLRMAYQMADELFQERRMAELGTAVLHGLRTPAIVVDRSLKLVFANSAAKELLDRADGLTQVFGHLSCVMVADSASMGNYISALTAAQSIPRGMSLRVRRASGCRPYLCLGQSIAGSILPSGQREPPLATLFVRDPSVRDILEPEALQKLYGFSPAEAAIAHALLRGQTLDDAARERGISYGTARTQLKSLFGKTGCRRQSDLIALLLASQPI